MFRRIALVGSLCLLALAAAAGPARANGRAPATSTIHFRRGMESQIAAGMTFGLVISKDGGATWQWMCEDAIGYGGMYDPDYVFTSTGALFATTFVGLKVNRNGCTFDEAFGGEKFVSTVAQGPDGAIYYGTVQPMAGSDPGDSKIYRSDDDGATFPISSEAGRVDDWWVSLEVAPSDPQRLYLSGFRFERAPGDEGGSVRVQLLFRSDDGGRSWTELPTTEISTMPNSRISIVGISKTNPAHVYARVELADNAISDAIYRSTDSGQTWTRILEKQGSIAFLIRGNGELVAGTKALGAFRSTDNGTTWTDLVGAPHIGCLAENTAGEVWACTENYGSGPAQSDGFGIMKSTNLATWTGVLRFQELREPVACAEGTVQHDTCDAGDASMWCGLCALLGCDPKRACESPTDGPPPVVESPKDGCCKSSAAPAPSALVLLIVVAMVVLKPRRRRGRA
ncbi:MAG: WD40/YVTN/BNR-like repeat-containing protein [Kofleriaceae bacterium]